MPNALLDPDYWRAVNERAQGLLGEPINRLNQFAGLLSGTLTPQEFANVRGQQIQESFQPTNALSTVMGLLGPIAYHGSPYTFDKFDMGKIGSGEGAQAYGHGLYFAENPKVAQGYRNALTDKIPVEINAFSHENGYGVNDPHTGVMNWFGSEREAKDFVRYKSGSVYKVNIPDDAAANMLHWDLPLSQQPAAMEAFRAARAQAGMNNDYWSPGKLATGSSEYGKLASVVGQDKASQLLRDAGIPGIKYLDGGSRAAGNGTYNYVVFDDQLPKILGRE